MVPIFSAVIVLMDAFSAVHLILWLKARLNQSRHSPET
jgi:hypothetical protein